MKKKDSLLDMISEMKRLSDETKKMLDEQNKPFGFEWLET